MQNRRAFLKIFQKVTKIHPVELYFSYAFNFSSKKYFDIKPFADVQVVFVRSVNYIMSGI